MHELYQSFVQIVTTEDRAASLKFVLQQLTEKLVNKKQAPNEHFLENVH